MQVLVRHWCPNQSSGKDEEGERKGEGRGLMLVAVPTSDTAAP